MENNQTVWKKMKKQSNPKWWIYCEKNQRLNVSVLINQHWDFRNMNAELLIEQF